MTWTKKESELAKVVVEELRERGWIVYQEVDVGSGTCDIVATRGRVLWAIECKVSLGLAVLAQARGWKDSANLVSVAVLPGRMSDTRRLALDAAAGFGIGVLEVYREASYRWRFGGEGSRLQELAKPALRRRTFDFLRKRLRPEQQTYAEAGNADGKRWTPYMATCKALQHVLDREGPLTIREAVAALSGQHHYANEVSARSSLYAWADAGKIDGVVLIRRGRGPALLGLVRHQAELDAAREPEPTPEAKLEPAEQLMLGR